MFADLVRIGFRVELMRKMAGMTQKELAEAAGVSRVTINYLESGRYQTRIATLNAVADALETTVSVLLGEDALPPEVRVPVVGVEAQYVVRCEACGVVATLNDLGEAEEVRVEHSVLHPPWK